MTDPARLIHKHVPPNQFPYLRYGVVERSRIKGTSPITMASSDLCRIRPTGSMNALIPMLVHHPPAGLDQSQTGEDQMHPRFAGGSEPGPHMAGERGEPAQQHPEEHGTSCRRSRDRRENGNKGAPEQREPTRHGEAEHDHQARKPGTKRSYPEGQAGSGTPADRRCFQRNQPPAAIMRRHPYWAKVNPK